MSLRRQRGPTVEKVLNKIEHKFDFKNVYASPNFSLIWGQVSSPFLSPPKSKSQLPEMHDFEN